MVATPIPSPEAVQDPWNTVMHTPGVQPPENTEITPDHLVDLLRAHEAYQGLFDKCYPHLRKIAVDLKQQHNQWVIPELKDVQTYSHPHRWITYSNKIEIIIEEGGVWADYLEGDSVLHRIQLTTDLFTKNGQQLFIDKQMEDIKQAARQQDIAARIQQLDYHEKRVSELRASLYGKGPREIPTIS